MTKERMAKSGRSPNVGLEKDLEDAETGFCTG